ncbi:MAG TPA: rRNA maturation RNase YbeY [Planctomycetaceae bacterium]|nr:rRNA maturation RNase YbeY [Planctomycetaceae bacterium]
MHPSFTPSTTDHWDDQLESAIQNAVASAAQARGFAAGRIGVMVTDDETIHEINRRHLDHDYPTDVISFTYDRSGSMVEGELVVSLCTARRSASEIGWDWRHELLLYVVHGTLHICGLEDSSAAERSEMRANEQAVLESLGIADARSFSPDQDQAFSAERS